MKYSLSDSEDESDDFKEKSAPKRKAVISDDDASFVPEPNAVSEPEPNTMSDSDENCPAPPPKALKPK